jgi:hypothetical protein
MLSMWLMRKMNKAIAGCAPLRFSSVSPIMSEEHQKRRNCQQRRKG